MQFSEYCDMHPSCNPLNAQLNPICHLLALLGACPFLHISKIRVNTGSACDWVSFLYNMTEDQI